MLDLTDSRDAMVGNVRVRRALPSRGRRTVGAWCFADHMGPAEVTDTSGLDIGPHPHTGLQTVTWLIEGEVLHRDSLGTEQEIRPGQLNLMTAGEGVSHSEEATGRYQGVLEGVQLWIAQPDATRHGAAAFEHHDDLPHEEIDASSATLLVGAFGDLVSPARCDTPIVGLDLTIRGATVLPLRRDFEYALLVLDGQVELQDGPITPGRLGYLGSGNEALVVSSSGHGRAMLLGGEPFPSRPMLWWNFVARTREEIDDAFAAWQMHDPRFGTVHSPLPRIESDPPWWQARRKDQR